MRALKTAALPSQKGTRSRLRKRNRSSAGGNGSPWCDWRRAHATWNRARSRGCVVSFSYKQQLAAAFQHVFLPDGLGQRQVRLFLE